MLPGHAAIGSDVYSVAPSIPNADAVVVSAEEEEARLLIKDNSVCSSVCSDSNSDEDSEVMDEFTAAVVR